MIDTTIISFVAGSGGNMVAAVIDDRDYTFTGWDYVLPKSDPRQKWREGCAEWKLTDRIGEIPRFNGDIPVMDASFAELRQVYRSVCSHFMWYHLRYNHNYIFIDCSTDLAANWCRARLDKHDFLLDDPTTMPGYIKAVAAYIAPISAKTIKLEDILDGNLITILKQWVDSPLNEDIYHAWLTANT